MQVIEKYKTDIIRLCLKHKVNKLYVFGSILTNEFKEDSDIDFVIDFQSMDVTQYADNYFDFKFSLQDILQRPIDLLEEKAIKNPFLKNAIIKQRQIVYEL